MKNVHALIFLLCFCISCSDDEPNTEKFNFQVGVYAYNSTSETFEYTTAKISIESDGKQVVDQSLLASSSQVDVKGQDNYVVTISKAGFESFVRRFTSAELKQYTDQELHISLYSTELYSDLAIYYPFSGDAKDASGNSHDGENHGAVLNADRFGNFNSAYHFNGTTDYIDLGNILDDLAYPFTVSVWVKRENHPATPYNPIFTSQEGTDIYNGFDLSSNSEFTNAITIGDGSGSNNSAFRRSKSVATATSKTGVWTHICAIVRDNNDMSIFIDGTELAGDYSGESSQPMDSDYPDDVAVIGKWTSNGITSFYTGTIDELRVWKRELSASEIKASM